MTSEPPASTSTQGLSHPDTRAKLQQQFKQYPGQKYTQGWAQFWEAGDFLPWDRGSPSPALAEVLVSHGHLLGSPFIYDHGDGSGKEGRKVVRRRKRALVPGCGRGVDVLLLQAFGYDAVGLEVAPKAVEACERFATENQGKGVYAAKDKEVGMGSVRFVLGDFYSDEWLEKLDLKAGSGDGDGDKFDLIYDYTFFCAMQPDMRPAWAKRMSDLLAPTQFANLVCLEFPTTKPAQAGGPPFSSPPKAYLEHLSHPGEKLEYSAEHEVRVNPFAQISPGGLERLAHFHPGDTHTIGKSEGGEISDYVSIWRHRY